MRAMTRAGVCLVFLTGAARTAAAQVDPPARLAAIADYVAADYAGAVANGRVLAAGEYQEQRGLLEEARSLTVLAQSRDGRDDARPKLLAAVERLIADFGAKEPESVIHADSGRLVALLFDRYGLAVGPTQPPSAPRAQEVFATSCALCHGDDGKGQTEKARTLTPPPVSFFSADRMARISPRVAFEALTYGVGNTGMASFDVFAPDDRWSLAFRVVAWRHPATPDVLARGRAVFRSAHPRLAVSPTRLSELSDADLDALLAPRLVLPDDRAAAVAWLRNEATFALSDEGTFASARRLLREVIHAVEAGQPVRELATRAYTEGVRNHAWTLWLRDRPLARRTKLAFADLERAAATANADSVRVAVIRAHHVLDLAEESDAGLDVVSGAAAMGVLLLVGLGLATVKRRRQ
jgi:high-affinity iron transporter